MHMNLFKILCFSCQGKSRDIVYQRICLFLWLIFAQHGLFEIQLTVYSALSRLTDLGIYDITRCGIWLLTIFHIPYIHFQRELRKVTSPIYWLGGKKLTKSNWNHSGMTKYVDLSKSRCCACASHWWCFIEWILLKSYWLSNKTLEISGIMKGKSAIAYYKYIVIVLRLVEPFCVCLICAIKLQPIVY